MERYIERVEKFLKGKGRGACKRSQSEPRVGRSACDSSAQTEGRAVVAVIDGHQGNDPPAYRNEQFADAEGEEMTHLSPGQMRADELSEMPRLVPVQHQTRKSTQDFGGARPRTSVRPALGSDSMWAEAAHAWESIPPEMRQIIIASEQDAQAAGPPTSTPHPRGRALKRDVHPTFATAPPQLQEFSPVNPNTSVMTPQTMNTTARDRQVVMFQPDAKNLPTFADDPKESWEAFLEEWLHMTRKYCWDDYQKAQWLPDSLRGGARQQYFRLVKATPGCQDQFSLLERELTKLFVRHKPLKGRSLWTLAQGKKTVGSYFDEVVTLGKSVYSEIPDQYKDMVLRDAFLNGLKESYQNALVKKRIFTLADAYKEAQTLEYADSTKETNRVASVREGPEEQPALKAIEKEMAWVKAYITESKRRAAETNKGDRKAKQPGNWKKKLECWNCGKQGHISKDCWAPKKKDGNKDSDKKGVKMVNSDFSQMSDEDFAAALLTQPPGDEEDRRVASVRASRSTRRSGGGKKPSGSIMLGVMLAVLACMVGSSEAAKQTSQLKSVTPRPMICGSVEQDRPALFKLDVSFACDANPTLGDNTTTPQDMKLMVYKRNLIEWKSTAHQCHQFVEKVTTTMSFFSDVKTKVTDTEDTTTTKEDCETMVQTKRCSAGTLAGGNGVFYTTNPVGEEYVYCCKPYEFKANQCSMIETLVYKTHDSSAMESPAGDVSHCQYEAGSCLLEDSTMLIWGVEKKEECEYEEWYELDGHYFDRHFVSNDSNMALTFTTHAFNGHTDCEGNPTTLSDQGLLVRFLTKFNDTAYKAVVEENTAMAVIDDDELALMAEVVNAVVEPLSIKLAEVTQQLFWASYSYTCHNIAETMRMMSVLLYEHPTPAARYIFQNPAISAKSGPDFLEIYPCTELDETLYRFQAMPEDNCTEYIPMSVFVGGRNETGFMNPGDNIIHKNSMTVSCSMMQRVPISVGGDIFYYSSNGTLEEAEGVKNASIPGLNLGAHEVTLHETIYNRAHRLNWNDFSHHRSLNDLLSTLSRQHQVLKAMGVSTDPHRSLESNVIESKEEVLGNALFAFLFGGHVASGFELWTLAMNCTVSLFILYLIGSCVFSCIKARGRQGYIAKVSSTEEPEEEQPVDTGGTSSGTQTDRTSVTYVLEDSPPSYAPVYPQLFPSNQ